MPWYDERAPRLARQKRRRQWQQQQQNDHHDFEEHHDGLAARPDAQVLHAGEVANVGGSLSTRRSQMLRVCTKTLPLSLTPEIEFRVCTKSQSEDQVVSEFEFDILI